MAEASGPEWQGKVTVELKGATAEQVWPFLEDFCGLDKLHPDCDTCRMVEGVAGKPGLVRYCASTKPVSPDGGPTMEFWVKERLLVMDPVQRLLSYQIIDNNMGFKYYVGTMKVLAMGDDQVSEFKSMIEWSFVADPIEGWTLESFEGYLKQCLQFMAGKIEQHVSSR